MKRPISGSKTVVYGTKGLSSKQLAHKLYRRCGRELDMTKYRSVSKGGDVYYTVGSFRLYKPIPGSWSFEVEKWLKYKGTDITTSMAKSYVVVTSELDVIIDSNNEMKALVEETMLDCALRGPD